MEGKRILAVGWFDNKNFQEICTPYLARIREVFFAWPGVKAARPMLDWTAERRAQLVADLRWAREKGIELDTIFNANCYGDIAMTETLADFVTERLKEMEGEGLLPEHLTTASPFIATVIRQRFPTIKIRWSVNMDFTTDASLEYVSDLFDSFYVSRNDCRRLDYVRRMSEWAAAHGKMMGLWANQGCLRNCPYHTFHNNLHGHDRMGQSAAAEKFHFTNFLCRTHYAEGHYEDFLKSAWIRPEELPRYEPYVGVVKLATRRHLNPEKIIRAYATCAYDGNMAEIVDPFYRFPKPIDNAALGASPLWPAVRDCPAPTSCAACGKCKALYEEITAKSGTTSSDLSASFHEFFRG